MPGEERDSLIQRLVGSLAEHPLSTTQRHVAWENAALRVECNQVRNTATQEDGLAVRIVPVAEPSYSAVVVPLAPDGGLYLVGRYRYPIARWSIEFPRFDFESGDAGWKSAAEADLFRVAELQAKRMSLLGAIEIDPALLGSSAVIILAEGCTHSATARPNAANHSGAEADEDVLVAGRVALQLAELSELVQQGEVTCGVTLAALSLYRARLR